jgi:hypothetical protein
MWCLFLLTRKASLLGEFLSNLSRLGLLRQIGDEDRATAKLRVKSYIQRFEARYGGPPNIARKKVLKTLCACSEAEAEAHGCSPKPLSTGFVPVVLATVLITFGWIITLPPWSFLSHVHFPIASPIWIALRPACNSNTLAFSRGIFFLPSDVVSPLRPKGPERRGLHCDLDTHCDGRHRYLGGCDPRGNTHYALSTQPNGVCLWNVSSRHMASRSDIVEESRRGYCTELNLPTAVERSRRPYRLARSSPRRGRC